MTIRIKVRAIAEKRGFNISSFQREAKIPMSTARRLWYSTRDGKNDGPPLQYINLETIEYLVNFFQITLEEIFTFEGDRSD